MTRGTRSQRMAAAVLVSLALNGVAARGQTLFGAVTFPASPERVAPRLSVTTEPRASADVFASWMKKTFKDFRPGSCTSLGRTTPSSSWPARGDAAVMFCQR